jgi:hypothetical protein
MNGLGFPPKKSQRKSSVFLFSAFTERRTLIPMASQNTVLSLTLTQDARLYEYRLPSGWKYPRANYREKFGVDPYVELAESNQSAVTNSDATEHLLGGVS